jgi:putative Mg2+ transporter-C (MgtC) family protein
MDLFDPFHRDFWIPIGVAFLCGTIIGLERQVRGKPAGVRTSILVCVSTTVFIELGAQFAAEGGDPTRVLGQLVTGVGFLGAGVMMSHDGTVSGVTTAAVIWILAAIGATIGLGRFEAAIALSLTTVLVLIGVELLETSLKFLTRGAHRRHDG